ncbi:MAG: hypothetical protein PVH24_03795, partial [Candidatus Zixiibacteriota bacterium]
MTLQIHEIKERSEIRDFILFPSRLHQHNPNWVPPLYREEQRLLNPKKNFAFHYCDAAFFVARNDREVLGRIAGIVNHRHNAVSGGKVARFGFLECTDDETVLHSMLDRVESWASSRGMERMVGPMGFTDQDPEGLLIEGHDEEPSIGSYMNLPYLPQLVERCGYTKEVDYVVYSVPIPDRNPAIYEAVHRRVTRTNKYEVIEFQNRRALKPYIKPIFRLVNETFSDLYGFVPLEDAEINHLSRTYLPVIDPRFLKVVTADKEVIGFILGMPNMNCGFRAARGRLLPLGFVKILRSARHARRLDLLLGAIKGEHR